MQERNRDILSRRWPGLLAALEAAPQPRRIEPLPNGSLRIDGFQVASRYDRSAEARLQAGLVARGNPSATVYGLGLGELPREMLRRAELERLTMVLFDPGSSCAALAWCDCSDWLGDARIELALARDRRGLARPFAVSPADLLLADEASARLRDLVRLALVEPSHRRLMDERWSSLQTQVRATLESAAADGDVTELFDAQPRRRAHVCAAGPTLSDHLERLAALPPGELLIAVDAAVRPLLAAGARPEAVVAIDPMRENLLRFFDADLSPLASSALVYAPTVHRDVLLRWPGRRLCFYPQHPRFDPLARERPRGRLFASGSVLHCAVDLAVRMGARECVLYGADFGFPRGRTHVEGTGLTADAPLEGVAWVVDGRGRRLASQPNLIAYLRDLEGYIASRPELCFFNAGELGARIEGAVPFGGQRDAA